MDILLTILKIIGIILLVVIGIILFMIIMILFVPVRYKLSGRNELEGERYLKGHVHWLLHIVSLHFSHDGDEFTYQIRIFGRKLSPKKHVSEEDLFEDTKEDGKDDAASVTKRADRLQTKAGTEQEDIKKEDTNPKPPDVGRVQRIPAKKNFFEQFMGKIKAFWQKIIDGKNTVRLFFGNIGKIKVKLTDIKEMLVDEKNKAIGLMGFREIQYLLHHFRFRKIDTDISFSMGDPALTGMTTGFISMFPVLYQYNAHVYPDFESEEIYARGTIDIIGHVRVLHLLASLIRLIKEKDVRALIKKWMNK